MLRPERASCASLARELVACATPGTHPEEPGVPRGLGITGRATSGDPQAPRPDLTSSRETLAGAVAPEGPTAPAGRTEPSEPREGAHRRIGRAGGDREPREACRQRSRTLNFMLGAGPPPSSSSWVVPGGTRTSVE
jgi:hypothetical protein